MPATRNVRSVFYAVHFRLGKSSRIREISIHSSQPSQPVPSAAGQGEIAGILLAAGASQRFGGDKLVHRLADGTPIALASALALRAAVPRMLAVVRSRDGELAQLFAAHGIETVTAEHAASGMGASLAAGIAATANASGWLIALADMPLVKTRTMIAIADALRAGAAIAAPRYRGQRGHPVGFAARFRDRLLALSGDEGARSVIKERAGEILLIDCDDAGVLADVDHPGDLADFDSSIPLHRHEKDH